MSGNHSISKAIHRAIATAAVVLLIASTGCGEPNETSAGVINVAVSLKADALAMAAGKKPIIVFISQEGCEYCRLLRARVLQPLTRSGELEERVVLREIRLDAGFVLDDFQGQRVSGQEFAARYDVDVTPTLLFLGMDGTSLTNPIVGTGNIEFYEVYLNKAIDAATARQNLQL